MGIQASKKELENRQQDEKLLEIAAQNVASDCIKELFGDKNYSDFLTEDLGVGRKQRRR